MKRRHARQIRRGILAARAAALAHCTRSPLPRRHTINRLTVLGITAYTEYVSRHAYSEWKRT